MFILGIYRGNIPQKVIYPLQKTFVSGKSQLLVQRKEAPRPPEQGLCPWTPLEEQPPDSQQWRQSIGIHGVRTSLQFLAVYGVKILCANMQKALASVELLPQIPYTGALPRDHTGGLPKFRPPDP